MAVIDADAPIADKIVGANPAQFYGLD